MHKRWSPIRFAQRQPGLTIALALGLVASAMPMGGFVHGEPFRRFLVGWNVTVWTYLVLIGWLIGKASHARTRTISEREDPNAALVLGILSLVAFTSLAAIGAELAGARQAADSPIRYILAGVTLLGSWLMLNTLFAIHYAHMFFRKPPGERPLRFPDDPPANPDFWDFLYFSFTIAVAAQTSDISVVAPAMRRAVLAHSVLAFLFNVAILGASINVAAGLLGTATQ